MKYFYAVEHGDDFSNDNGSTVKREARKMATALHREFPGEEIRVTKVDESGEFCAQWIVYNGVAPGLLHSALRNWSEETLTRMEYGAINIGRTLPKYDAGRKKWIQEATDSDGYPVSLVATITNGYLTSVRVTRPR